MASRPRADPSLDGLRILVVEDTWLIAEAVREDLEKWGCTVLGPVAGLAAGLEIAQRQELDGAILDVNLGRCTSLPIADVLDRRGIPFAFITGYSETAIPPKFREAPRLRKPYAASDLAETIARHFRNQAAHGTVGGTA
jgi:DNA-binding response OmpR family regulator